VTKNFLCSIGDEGNWAWAHSHEFLTDSFWGTIKPNNRTGNSDDCCVMVLHRDAFWWEDRSCLVHDIQHHEVAPICQHGSTTASTTSTGAPVTTTSFECPSSWQEFENHCYIAQTSGLDWNNAEKSCLSLGSHLVSVHSKAEFDFVSGLQQNSFWIGGNWSSPDYEWTWSDLVWDWDYEVQYQKNSGSSSLCIYIYQSIGFVSYYCSESHRYVCKI